MSITDLIESGNRNITVSVSLKDLQEYSHALIGMTESRLTKVVEEQKAERYLSVDEVCQMLGVSRPTLSRWQKKGYLTPYKLGGKLKYRRTELYRMLNDQRL